MRNKRLDVLRCIAVLLVMCHHSGPHFSGIIPIFNRFGWSGVDLFFVLSGFLISGLLFADYKKRQRIDVKRFLIRRAFKIYPSFYVFLLVAGVAAHLFAKNMETTTFQYLHEAFFVQNYSSFVWGHTWSLAVEEHFYILLPIFLILLARYGSNVENPFRLIPAAWVGVAILSIASRALFLLISQPNPYLGLSYRATNSRMDALFFGVLLGYFYNFAPLKLMSFVERNRLALAITSTVLIAIPFFVSRESISFVLFGYTGLYLGFGAMLLLALFTPIRSRKMAHALRALSGPMAFLGAYSYSIYLWHVPVSMWMPAVTRRAFHLSLSAWPIFGLYMTASLALGVLLARLVEFPVLKLRDRWFPTSRRATAGGGPSQRIQLIEHGAAPMPLTGT
jgi:peptidoglycan/LPS O-acetylase OafA/YrhL